MPPSLQARYGSRVNGESLYRITLRLAKQSITSYGTDEPLRPGLALEADIVRERRHLIEWLIEPLFAFAQRNGGADVGATR